MASHKFTAGLNSASFPFLSRLVNRSVVIPGIDNKFRDPSSSNTENRENNPNNLPQLLFCENVMPQNDGITTVRTAAIQAAFPDPADALRGDNMYILRDPLETTWYFVPAAGKNYVTGQLGSAPWVSTSPIAGAPFGDQFSIAYVNGVTYICYATRYFGHWDSGTGTFVDDSAGLLGVAMINVRSIAGVGNYLVLLTIDNAVHWSSLTNPLDLVPSASTGAGSQIPVDLRGAALALTPITGGFLIHCVDTTIAAIYTNNVASPWLFREVKNAGGIPTPGQYIAKDTTGASAYIYGTKGIQQMDLREATNVHADVSTFLGNGITETYDYATHLLTLNRTGKPLPTKIRHLLNRFLCISYTGNNPNQYEALLVYDQLLRRWGKIVTLHADVFAISTGDDIFSSDDIANAITLLRLDGTCFSVLLGAETLPVDVGYDVEQGVAIFGKYQISRSRRIVSQDVELDVLDALDDVDVFVAGNHNGTTVGTVLQMVEAENTDNYRHYQKQLEAENISFILQGNYKLSSMLVTATRGGSL